MKVTVRLVIVGALWTVHIGLEKWLDELEIRGRTQTKALLRSTRIPRSVLETWGDLLSHRLQWKSTGQFWCKRLITIIMWPSGNRSGKLYLTILSNVISTNQNLSWRMRHKIIWYFEIEPDYLILVIPSDR